MAHPRAIISRLTLLILLIIAAIVVVVLFNPAKPKFIPTTIPVTQPATHPTTVATSEPASPPIPKTFLDVVRAAYPAYPTTQPLSESVELRDAAALVISSPTYLCPRADLWITQSDADDIKAVLLRAYEDRTHVLRERVKYVHWAANENGDWLAHPIVPSANGFELIIPPPAPPPHRHVDLSEIPDPKRIALPKQAYDWDRAFSWDGKIVVPTDTGVDVLGLEKNAIVETYQSLLPQRSTTQPIRERPQVLLESRGLIAWIPNTSDGVYRFVDDKWIHLSKAQDWPEKILHLVPLLDGSILQIVPKDADTVDVRLTIMDAPQVNAERINQLIDNLSDVKDSTRTSAFEELQRYGPGIWPILEKAMPDQPPEAQIRLRQILQNKIVPTLGGFSLINNHLRLVSRYPNGGAIFYADSLSAPTEKETPEIITPAWLSIIPGQPITLLSPRLTHDLRPDSNNLSNVSGEWIAYDEAHGPQRFTGVSLLSILPKEHCHFRELLGKDSTGRWLFRDPAHPEITLILDPTLPDPTPRLPVWNYSVPGGSVGWDANNWPVVKAGGAFAIERASFRALTAKDRMFTRVDEMPPATAPSTRPATSRPATTQAGPVLLHAPEGDYYGGNEFLILAPPTGNIITWALPPTATGALSPWLVRSSEGLLFLYNQPGRILRIRPNFSSLTTNNQQLATPPFKLEATFTKRIPNIDHPTRIWLDPDDRIIIADKTQVSILFPSGRIPRSTLNLIPANELDDRVD